MHPPAGTSKRLIPAALALVAFVAFGCGSSEEPASATDEAASADPADFPEVEGRTLEEIAADIGTESELVVSPSGQVFHEGRNRFGFGVFTLGREPVSDASVAIYAARPDGKAKGPFPAEADSLRVGAPFQSESTSTDPDAPESIYSAEVDLNGKGEWRIMAVVRRDDGLAYSLVPSAVVGRFPKVPTEGEMAPKIETLTASDVGGDVAKIDTRQPPTTMHEQDFSKVLGSEPVVLLFATPALCSSRVCGPVADIAEEVKAERGDEAAFIMQEIYEDNNVEEGLREQVEDFNLPTEPWLFVIDERGKISTAIEGAFSKEELEAALDEVSSDAAA